MLARHLWSRYGINIRTNFRILKSENLQHRIDQDRDVIITGFGTEQYVDKDGENHLGMVILLEEEGRFFRFLHHIVTLHWMKRIVLH